MGKAQGMSSLGLNAEAHNDFRNIFAAAVVVYCVFPELLL